MKLQVPFIGRMGEIDLINNLAKRSGVQVLCLGGQGGIGKTSLLRTVNDHYKNNQTGPVSITDIIDFDNYAAHDIDSIRQQFIEDVKRNEFNPYLAELEVLHKMEIAEVGHDAIIRQRHIVYNDFKEAFDLSYADQRVILFFDTAEMIRRLSLEAEIVNLVTGLKNCFSIVAGRNIVELWKLIQAKLGNQAIYYELPPLEEDVELIDHVQKAFRVNLPKELKEELLILAGGRPIWIFLAIEWLTRSATEPKRLDDRYSLSELKSLPQAELKHIREEFGQRLVQNIATIRSPKDQLLLILSRIYPLTADMIAEILDEDSAQGIFDDAIAYPYIKTLRPGFISLHDDMRDMINKYVWPRIDPFGERRKRDSRWAIDHLINQTNNLRLKVGELNKIFAREMENVESRTSSDLISQIICAEQDLWASQFQRLEHAWFVDIKDGKKLFTDLFDEATNSYRMLIREKLIERAQSLIIQIPLDERYEIDLRIVQALLYTAKFKEAQDILLSHLSRTYLTDTQRASFTILLGRSKIGLGQIHECIDDFAVAQKLADHLSVEEQVASSRWLGQGYLNLGQYETAMIHLQHAKDLCKSIGFTLELGWILNDLAYVYSRLEYLDLERASLDAAKEAETHWRISKNERGRGALYVVYMSIYKRRREFDKSLDYGDRAWNIFEPQNDLEWLCRISFEKGVALLEKGEFQHAKEQIERARDFGIIQFLPEIYYWLAQTYISSGDERLAYDCSIEGLRLAKNSNPQYYLYLLSQQVRLANMLGYFEQINDFEVNYRDYKDTYSEIQQPAAESLLNYFLGTLAIQAYRFSGKKEAAASAIAYLKEAIPGIAQHIVYGEFQLPNALAKLNNLLNDGQSVEWKRFKQTLGQELNDIWCNKIIKKQREENPEAGEIFNQWQL